MTRRISIFVFGVLSYVLFFGVFLYAAGFVNNWLVPRSLDSGPYPGAAVADQIGVLQAGQVCGDARLRQPGDRGQLRHRHLVAFQQGQEPHPGGVGQYLEAGRPGVEIHIYPSIRI